MLSSEHSEHSEHTRQGGSFSQLMSSKNPAKWRFRHIVPIVSAESGQLIAIRTYALNPCNSTLHAD